MKSFIQKIWNDPVWSKVIATAVVAIVAWIVSNWNSIVSFFSGFLPNWIIYSVAGSVVLTFGIYIVLWIINAKSEHKTKPIFIREDLMAMFSGDAGKRMCGIIIDYDKNMLFEEVVRTTKDSMWEYSLHGLDYGKDWQFLSWEHRLMLPRSELKKTLRQLGIKPGFVLEIVPNCTRERLKAVPPHPDSLINYGSCSE